MDPATATAIIAPLSQVGGAAMGGKAASKSAKAQLTANREALAFQKDEARLKREADERRFAAWNAGREALMKRYGIDIAPPNMQGLPPGGGAPGGVLGGGPPAVAATRPAGGPGNIRDLIGSEAPPELGDWSNWARYGLGGPRGA